MPDIATDSTPSTSCTVDSAAQRNALLADVASLPALPGVYRFFDAHDQVLYVGKAVQLKRRVASYFQRDHGGTRIGFMVGQIARLEVTVVQSEAEALILENNLIKTLRPKYNILFRDDKSYPYLRITTPRPHSRTAVKASHTTDMGGAAYAAQATHATDTAPAPTAYPRMSYYRGATDSRHQYFGPYPNAHAVKDTIALLQKVFLLRTCEDSVFANRTRPCLLHQIKRCSAPCVGAISPAAYAHDVADAVRFLRGEGSALLDQLQERMMQHATHLEFEQAAALRDQIAALSAVLHQQNMQTSSDQDADIIAIAMQGGRACINLAMVRGGRHLGDRPYFPSQMDAASALLAHMPSDDTPDIAHAPSATESGYSTDIPPHPIATRHQSKECIDHHTPCTTAQTVAPSLTSQQTMASVDSVDSEATLPTSSHHISSQAESVPYPPSTPQQKAIEHHTHLQNTILQHFIAQHYMDGSAPAVIISNLPLPAALVQALQQQAGRKITTTHQPREHRRAWLRMAIQNAQLQLARLLAEEGSQLARTQALAQALGLPVEQAADLHIECFDISHTAGEATQASCVVFTHCAMQPAQYRRYHITDITPGDDYAAMRQVLQRRYGRLAQALPEQQTDTADTVHASNGTDGAATTHATDAGQTSYADNDRHSRGGATGNRGWPDIILIDGGKGQVAAAAAVCADLGVELSRIVGVEKGEGRKVGREELVFADGRKKIWLGQDSAALLLIAQIRDEAHRFAITGMRTRRAKVRTGSSQLQDIPGIGPRRRARLLQRFGGIAGVARASEADLASVEGISADLARQIYQYLH